MSDIYIKGHDALNHSYVMHCENKVYNPMQNNNLNELSTPIIKNARRYINIAGALKDRGSAEVLTKGKVPRKEVYQTLNMKSRRLESIERKHINDLSLLSSVNSLRRESGDPSLALILNDH